MRAYPVLFLSLFLGWAQRPVCGTDMAYEQALRENPEMAELRRLLEEATRAFIAQKAPQPRTQSDCPQSDYIIPVVVHIIHSGDGRPDSLPVSRVLFQIEQLFDDYRKRPYSKAYSSGTDTRIEFSLATKDPNGNPHSGVTYTHYSDAGLSEPRVQVGSTSARTLKQQVGWPPNRYLNIWVIQCIYQNDPSNCDVLGFATLPGSSPPSDQGVMVQSGYFGLRNKSQTTTHEVGHYLNLVHPFHPHPYLQNGCEGMTNSNCETGGDQVCDTPPTRQANYDNARRQNTCKENIGNIGGDRPDQVRNFMDYLNDPSLDIFTSGQRSRMTAALNSAGDRWPLWQSTNLEATGTGPHGRIRANFAMESCEQPPCHVCPGQSIKLISYSTGRPHKFSWQIINRNGNVVRSSDRGPCESIQAPSDPGVYNIRLEVENRAGRAETTYTGFLVVRDPTQVRSYPFSEGFEGSAFPPAGWVRHNPDFATANSNLTWERYTRGSYGASRASAYVRNFYYYNRTQRDHLITPLIQIPASAQHPAIEFDVYYRALYWENMNANPPQHGYLYGDTLAVYISRDCGTTWERLFYQGGEDLDITGNPMEVTGRNLSSSDQAIPPQGANRDWRHVAIRIPASYIGEKVLICFENITEMGNHLYIDSIQVRENASAELAGPSLRPGLMLSPNPTSDESALLIQNAAGLSLQWTLYNTLGQALYAGESLIPGTEERVKLPSAALPAGLYLIKVQLGSETTLLRLVKE